MAQLRAERRQRNGMGFQHDRCYVPGAHRLCHLLECAQIVHAHAQNEEKSETHKTLFVINDVECLIFGKCVDEMCIIKFVLRLLWLIPISAS